MINRQDRFQGARKLGIFWQCWLPEDDPASVIVIAHGASEHSDRYQHVVTNVSASGDPSHVVLPHVHLVASLVKR